MKLKLPAPHCSSGLNCAPRKDMLKSHPLLSKTCECDLFRNRVTEVSRQVETRPPEWPPSTMTGGVLMRRGDPDADAHTGGGVAAMRGWGQARGRCTHRPRAAGECREPGVGQRARPPSEPPVGADLLLRPRFWTSSPQNCEGNFCCFKPPKSRRWELTQSVWCHNDPPPRPAPPHVTAGGWRGRATRSPFPTRRSGWAVTPQASYAFRERSIVRERQPCLQVPCLSVNTP